MNRVRLLSEELKDINKYPHNIHYTNEDSLVSILMDGYLKGSSYSFTLNKNRTEISTLRRSEDKRLKALKNKDSNKYYEKMKDLSENIGNVKIYLFSERIKSGVRGIRKYPIAEFNVSDIKLLNEYITNLYKIFKIEENNEGVKYEDFKKDFKSFITNIIVEKKLKPDNKKDPKNDEVLNEIGIFLSEKYKIPQNLSGNFRFSILSILRILIRLKNLESQREAEERFYYDSGKRVEGIPVKKEFMKIRFLTYDRDRMEQYREIYPYMVGNKNSVFLKDKIFYKILQETEKKVFRKALYNKKNEEI